MARIRQYAKRTVARAKANRRTTNVQPKTRRVKKIRLQQKWV